MPASLPNKIFPAGFALREDLGVLSASGPDTRRFLQGQLTQDVSALPAGASTLGACCNPQGRMRALFWLYARDEDLLLIMPRSVIPLLLEALKKYAVFFKVQLCDASAHWQILQWHRHSPEGLVITLGAELSYQLLPAAAPLPQAIPGTAEQCSAETLRAAEIAAGLSQIFPETVEKFLPHQLNLPELGGVNFKKGCYTGQEIIARMEYRGKVKNRLLTRYCATTAALLPGSEIRAGAAAVGELVCSAALPQGGRLLLANIQESALEQKLDLQLEGLPILEPML